MEKVLEMLHSLHTHIQGNLRGCLSPLPEPITGSYVFPSSYSTSIYYDNMMDSSLVTFNNEVFSRFATYCIILILKMMSLSLLTLRIRFKRKVFANPEDCHGPLSPKQHVKPVLNDQLVERVRRCHLNDLENIVPFVIVGLFYVISEPDPWWATMHFRIFTVSRILHTTAYVSPVPQPMRFITFFLGFFTTLSMTVNILQKSVF